MTVSSRTPEGSPSKCPVCNAETNIVYCDPGQDAVCPNCGSILQRASDAITKVNPLVVKHPWVPPLKVKSLADRYEDTVRFISSRSSKK